MALITSEDVIRRFRSDVDDVLRAESAPTDADALWSIADVNDYIADAVERLARRSLSEFQMLVVNVVANEPLCKLSSSLIVLDIDHVYMNIGSRTLHSRNVDSLVGYNDDYGSMFPRVGSPWETRTGTPIYYLRDLKNNALRLIPIPVVNDTLNISATVAPAYVEGAPLPFTTREDMALILLWMKHLAYSKHDADTFDPTRASMFADQFERDTLDRRYEAQRLRHSVQHIRFSW